MAWSSARRDTQAGGVNPRARARNRCGIRPGSSNRTVVTRTDSRAGTGGRGSRARGEDRESAASISGRAACAAASPRAMMSRTRLNPNAGNARTSGLMSTSQCCRCWSSESQTRNDTDCTRTSTNETMLSRGSSGSVTSLQISRSAPRARASCAGRLRTTPPSMRIRPSISTGEKTLGIAVLARMTSGRKP